MKRSYDRWGLVHFRSDYWIKFRFANTPYFWVIRLDLFKHSWFVVYRKNALENYYDDISYGFL